MSKPTTAMQPVPATSLPENTLPTVELKDPVVAAVLAWLIPGWGHWYQGRKGKAVLYLVCILGTFIYGLYLGDGRVVYASWKYEDRRLPFLCQIGVGLPALPALVQAYRLNSGKEPLSSWMAPPFSGAPVRGKDGNVLTDEQGNAIQGPPFRYDMRELDRLQKKLHRYWELGTVYTMIAGLLNILAIYDAWGGPVYVEESKPRRKKKEEGESPPPSETPTPVIEQPS